jgi:PST family polysaccharide transporter
MKFQNSTVFRNFIYLFSNQFFNLIIPLLVFPFLVKTLGIANFGLYSLAYAGIIFCFMLCDYGFNFSGSKYIAINKEDIALRDEAFSTILSLKLSIALLVSVGWMIYVFCNPRFEGFELFAMLFTGMIFGNAINIQWFFQGLEKLGWFSTVNSAIKLISNIMILFVVKSPGDMYLIPLIYSMAFLLSGIITIIMAVRRIKVRMQFFSFRSSRLFLREGMDYFITIGTTSLVFNGTIIILSFFEKSILIIGAFSALDRIIKILVSVYVPYSTAIYPRNMANFQVSREIGIRSVIKYGSIALVCSVLCILFIQFFSPQILHFLDPHLEQYASWLQVFSVWLFFIIVNNLIGYHFLNGLNRSSVFRNTNIIYTAITLVLMIFGCALYSFRGCIVAVLLGEVLLTAMLLFISRSEKPELMNVIRNKKLMEMPETGGNELNN